MNKSFRMAAAAGLSMAAGLAAAQTTTLQYQGRVTSIMDDLGVFEGVALGLAASGTAVIDLDSDNFVIDIDGANQANAFPIVSVDTTVLDDTYTGVMPAALVLDDLPPSDPAGDPVDLLLIGAGIEQPIADDAFLGFDFQGSGDLFSDAGIGNATQLDLNNLEVAEVTIEFRNDNGDGTFSVSTLIIEVLTLTVDGAGGEITLACLPDTNENGEIDFGDFNTWISLFNAGDYRADINLDGDVTPADFSAWIAAYNRGC